MAETIGEMIAVSADLVASKGMTPAQYRPKGGMCMKCISKDTI